MRALPFWAVFAVCAAAPLAGEFGILVALAAGALLLGARLGGAREIPLWKPVALMLAPLGGWVALALIGL
ncbi:hypothetical protein M1105_17445 [Limibaculum sp. FT325]|uniref:hypothetical protein n=1 Tax=Thermohalobaculum sediminis TaxID=2939436 RepID=UPI0020C0A7ED|nr:hypothetical protein [Limibaculum sediminis]MCL5778764.1 hypothetical protein [Limibaculum sediminis]